MRTEIYKIQRNDQTDNDPVILRAGQIIKEGGLVAFPTETVYGLGGDALNPEASGKIYSAKGRPSDNPLIVHIAEFSKLSYIVKSIPDIALKLYDAFCPGPLTMIFEKSDAVPYATTGGLDTVAVRMPNDALALSFIKASGGYIAAPSANISGRPSPTTAQHVYEDLNGRIEMILDGGPCTIGLESTIVDLTGPKPMILRPGYISLKMLSDVCGEVLVDPVILGTADPGAHPKAPGMKYRHYAPKGNLSIVSGPADNVCSYINDAITADHSAGKRVGVIAVGSDLKKYSGADFLGNAGDLDDEITISSSLYNLLRQCDDENIDTIYSEEFDTPMLGMAIMNRLMKAAGHTVIKV